MVSEKLQPFGTTIFAEMTGLAVANKAINLSQGFPDFDGPEIMIEAAMRAMRSGQNQYARSMGHPELVQAVADHQRRFYDLSWDWQTEVSVFSGATEGIASSMLGLLNPGDEVILFEPFYDSYPACVALAGATARYCTLRAPDFALDLTELEKLFNQRTRLLVLNTPHNPSGKVFTRDELKAIADLCQRHDVTVLSDEVYEHLTYDGAEHIPMATIPGMRDRTLTLSSAGKTFSMTGWKIGWATGPAALVAAAQAAHQFVVYSTATPFQLAVAHTLRESGEAFFRDFRHGYTERRDRLIQLLGEAGFDVFVPKGTYFVLAGFERLYSGNDREFAKHLTEQYKVAAIPPSVFYKQMPEAGSKMLRFAFCKSLETIDAAGKALAALAAGSTR